MSENFDKRAEALKALDHARRNLTAIGKPCSTTNQLREATRILKWIDKQGTTDVPKPFVMVIERSPSQIPDEESA